MDSPVTSSRALIASAGLIAAIVVGVLYLRRRK